MAPFGLIIAAMFLNLFVVSSAFEHATSRASFPIQHYPADKRMPAHLNNPVPKFWVRVGECPAASDGGRKFYCPSVNNDGHQICVDDYQLCNGVKECPNAEDENMQYCLFYHALRSQVRVLERGMASLGSVNYFQPEKFDNYYDK